MRSGRNGGPNRAPPIKSNVTKKWRLQVRKDARHSKFLRLKDRSATRYADHFKLWVAKG